MTMPAPASLGSLRLARDTIAPRRMAAGRAEWHAFSSLTALTEDWRSLCARALEPNVFYDPAFALAAAPVFGRNVGAVLVWSKAGDLIGLFPARIERRYGVMATLTGWTHPYAPLGTPLVDRDEHEAAITAFLDHIESDEKLPKLVLLPMLPQGPFATALARILLRHGGAMAHHGAHTRAMLAPAEREGYLEHTVPGKKLKELRRQRRRLESTTPVSLSTADKPEAIAAALEDFMHVEASGWKAGSAASANSATQDFMRAAVTGLGANGAAQVHRLMHMGRPLAAAITLRSNDQAWFWKIAYDEVFAKSSPGVQLTLDLTRTLLVDDTLTRVDSCATAGHPMIDHLWRERLELSDALIASSGAALTQFHLAQHLETLRRVLMSSAKTLRNRVKG
jgi:CelD/BcsL family acetyltransferase involved in cellulose biosynthesis